MKRLALPGLACALALTFGCGPMTATMPPRLDPEAQKEIDQSWDRAFSPADKFNRQELLDVMVGTQAYQLGVDTFTLRAEKKLTAGKVVMEINFDRAKPEADRFEVTVLDPAGKVVRRERYGRQEIEETHHVLFARPDQPGMANRRAEHEARWKRIQEVFPQQTDPNPAAPGPQPARG
jgi:hypothetical protein